jgi:hypothetical protein
VYVSVKYRPNTDAVWPQPYWTAFSLGCWFPLSAANRSSVEISLCTQPRLPITNGSWTYVRRQFKIVTDDNEPPVADATKPNEQIYKKCLATQTVLSSFSPVPFIRRNQQLAYYIQYETFHYPVCVWKFWTTCSEIRVARPGSFAHHNFRNMNFSYLWDQALRRRPCVVALLEVWLGTGCPTNLFSCHTLRLFYRSGRCVFSVAWCRGFLESCQWRLQQNDTVAIYCLFYAEVCCHWIVLELSVKLFFFFAFTSHLQAVLLRVRFTVDRLTHSTF